MHIERLVHSDSRSFELSLVELRQLREHSKNSIEDLVRILKAFNADEVLSDREKGRRIGLIFETWNPKPKELTAVARLAHTLSATTRNSLLSFFPPELQQEVYRSAPETENEIADDSVIEPENIKDSDTERAVSRSGSDSSFQSPEEPNGDRLVLLLGGAEKHEANILYLKANGFEPLRASSPKDRDDLMDNSICGIVVDGSWWTHFPSDQHAEELKRILGYSTFAFVRVDSVGLDAEVIARMSSLAREIKFRDSLAAEFQWGVSRVGVNDISALNDAVSLLSTSSVWRFHPAEISEAEGEVLLAAVKRKVKNRHPLNGLEVERVATSLLPGGRTNARVFMLKPNDRGAPFVAKIDSVPALRDEMTRYTRFVSHRENWLRPELHTQGKIGMILFSLVDDVDKRDAPAPTLESCLRDLSAIDRGLSLPHPPSCSDLKTAVQRTVAKLAELNSDRCDSTDIKNWCWLGVEPLYKLRENGVTYSINGSTGALDLISLAEKAIKKIVTLNGQATVHGDVHGRNVLIRDREPFLIDYALTGPGHPCFDLVRFESSLVFNTMRMTVDEEELESYFKQLFIEGKSFGEMLSPFQLLCSSEVNAVVLQSAISARDAAMEMARKYGGDGNDYIAVKFVVACQALTMPEPQSGIVRVLIRALAPIIEEL